VTDPSWLAKYKVFEGLSILTLIFGLLTLCVYGVLEGCGKFHKAWPCDAAMQVIHALLIIGAGIVLIIGLEEVFAEGKKPFQACDLYLDSSYDSSIVDEAGALNASDIASDKEIRSLVNYPVIMTAGVS